MNPQIQAVILGVVEGLTEFLPISSTGHLIVAERLLGYQDAGETFTIVIQLGAILAVVWFYWRELWGRLRALLGGQPSAARFWLNIVIGSIPAALIGLTLEKVIKSALFNPTAVAVSLIVGGVILWVVETRRAAHGDPDQEGGNSVQGGHGAANLDDITPLRALLIGLAQAVAVIPGVSRSGASIVGGLLLGLPRVTATAFSFFLGLPVLGAAGLLSLYKARGTLSQVAGGGSALLIGTVVSFIVALLSIGWLLRYVSSHNFKGFAVYRVIFGVILLILVAAKVL